MSTSLKQTIMGANQASMPCFWVSPESTTELILRLLFTSRFCCKESTYFSFPILTLNGVERKLPSDCVVTSTSVTPEKSDCIKELIHGFFSLIQQIGQTLIIFQYTFIREQFVTLNFFVLWNVKIKNLTTVPFYDCMQLHQNLYNHPYINDYIMINILNFVFFVFSLSQPAAGYFT